MLFHIPVSQPHTSRGTQGARQRDLHTQTQHIDIGITQCWAVEQLRGLCTLLSAMADMIHPCMHDSWNRWGHDSRKTRSLPSSIASKQMLQFSPLSSSEGTTTGSTTTSTSSQSSSAVAPLEGPPCLLLVARCRFLLGAAPDRRFLELEPDETRGTGKPTPDPPQTIPIMGNGASDRTVG